MYDRETELSVAAALEEIAVMAKTMCNDIRDGVPNPYARVYWLRTQLSRQVARLGCGQPGHQREIAVRYESQVRDS